jgi:hypothetical protein
MKHLLQRRRDSDALLDGHPLEAGADLGEVDAFLAEMRADFAALPAPTPRPTLAATLDGRRELRPASGPTPKPTVPEPGPRVHYHFKPVAALLAGGLALFGGLATAGALPGPIQRATADATSHLGIDLPGTPSPTAPPASGPRGARSHADRGNGTRSGSHPRASTDPDGGTSTTTPSTTAGGTAATTVVPGGPTAPSIPSVTVPPVVPTTPTIPLTIPTLGTTPPGALPTIPRLITPDRHLGVLHHHRVP